MIVMALPKRPEWHLMTSTVGIQLPRVTALAYNLGSLFALECQDTQLQSLAALLFL